MSQRKRLAGAESLKEKIRKHIHGKDRGTASNIENNLVLENVLVLDNGVHVRPRAHLIFL